jgi:hypothetical protein
MAYATLDEFRGPLGSLDQFADPDPKDTLLQTCLDDAEAILNTELGFTLTLATSGDRVVYGDGTAYLALPLYVPGSIDAIVPLTGYTVPAYVEQDGILVTTDASGILYPSYSPYGYGLPYISDPLLTAAGLWSPRVPYTITADWGASADDMKVARRITLELAVQLFRFKDAGGAQVLGVEGAGAVVVKNSFSPIIQQMITRLKRSGIGVW